MAQQTIQVVQESSPWWQWTIGAVVVPVALGLAALWRGRRGGRRRRGGVPPTA